MVSPKHIATFLLGAAAGYALFKYNSMTDEEKERIVGGNIRELPGNYETSDSVLGSIQNNALFKRPDDYQATLASKYKAMTKEEMDKALRDLVDPDKVTWVVVGDAAKVKPQLEGLGLTVEMQAQAANTDASKPAN